MVADRTKVLGDVALAIKKTSRLTALLNGVVSIETVNALLLCGVYVNDVINTFIDGAFLALPVEKDVTRLTLGA